MTPLPRIMVAPTGARKTKADHPALPTTPPQIVADARACARAGADGLHLHIRDAQGAHSIDPGAYRDMVAQLAEAVPQMAVQITTEAAGRFTPAQQRDAALTSGASMVSVSIREMTSDDDMTAARDFYTRAAADDIAIQHILYDLNDLDLLRRTLPADLWSAPGLQLLYVLGRYSASGISDPADVAPFVDQLAQHDIAPDWALCAFGVQETACLVAAHRAGGKIRVGFENSHVRANGAIAAHNAQRVADMVTALAP